MGRGAGGTGRGRRGTIMPEGVAERFAGVPPEHLALVREVRITDGVFAGDRPMMGKYVNGTRTIELDRISEPSTARHEVGHAVWYHNLTDFQRIAVGNDYGRAMSDIGGSHRATQLNYLSVYAASNEREAWATAYSMWTGGNQSERGRVERFSPILATVLRDVGA